MGPSRLLIIRHAEQHGEPGVDPDGSPDEESLTIRGWQRAGALVKRLFPTGIEPKAPVSVFASGIGHGSQTRRPQQTVEPLIAHLHSHGGVEICTRFLKPEVGPLMAEVMTREGVVVIAWEHSMIPKCVAALPDPPSVPEKWADDRYDLIWVLERQSGSWRFTQEAQMILAGDRDAA